MRLVDHVGDIRNFRAHVRLTAFSRGCQPVVNQKQLVRVGAANYQVIICVLAVVEVKIAKAAFIKEESDNLLDVYALRMVPEIYQHLRLRPQF